MLCSTAKLLTKILSQQIVHNLDFPEEQQGFRSNRSTTDSIFINRLIEKDIEFNKPTFEWEVNLSKNSYQKLRARRLKFCVKMKWEGVKSLSENESSPPLANAFCWCLFSVCIIEHKIALPIFEKFEHRTFECSNLSCAGTSGQGVKNCTCPVKRGRLVILAMRELRKTSQTNHSRKAKQIIVGKLNKS